MNHFSLRPHILMGSMVALLLVITAGAGLLHNEMYLPFLSVAITRFQRMQDLLSLLMAPVLIWAMVAAARGSRRGFVIWTGTLVYVAYYYAFYAFGFVYTVYYPLYLALLGLSTYSVIALLAGADVVAWHAAVGARLPRRMIGAVLGMTGLFVPIWSVMLVEGISTGVVQETALVFVLDLAFLIPACVYSAFLVWRRKAYGSLFCGPLLVKAALSGLLLTGGEVMRMMEGLPPAWGQLTLYLLLATVGTFALVHFLNCFGPVATPLPRANAWLPLGHRNG